MLCFLIKHAVSVNQSAHYMEALSSIFVLYRHHAVKCQVSFRKHDIFTRVILIREKIITAVVAQSLKITLMLYARNIIGSSSDVFGYLQKSSNMFGTCSETFVWPSVNFWRIFRRQLESVRKSSKNRQKCRHRYVYIMMPACRYEISLLVFNLISQE